MLHLKLEQLLDDIKTNYYFRVYNGGISHISTLYIIIFKGLYIPQSTKLSQKSWNFLSMQWRYFSDLYLIYYKTQGPLWSIVICELIQKLFFALIYVVEFRKRGLLHVHLLIWLNSESKRIWLQKWTNMYPLSFQTMKQTFLIMMMSNIFIIHDPCGKQNPKCACIKNFNASNIFQRSKLNFFPF